MKVTVVVSRTAGNGYRASAYGAVECTARASTLGELVRKIRKSIEAAAGRLRPRA